MLVLHSDDDPIVPAFLGQRLVDRTKEAGEDDENDDDDVDDDVDDDDDNNDDDDDLIR